jgi:DNA replication and repair protein RecF
MKTFRNYESATIDFSPGINFIIGDNGSGKTNILEALSIISGIRSFRNIQDSEIVKWKNHSYYASALVGENEEKKFEVGFSLEGNRARKKVKIDNTDIRKISDYYGRLLTVIISPGDINIINGEPDLRRRFVDSVISKLDLEYFETLNDLKKTVISRNSILKQIRDRKISDTRQLDPWDTMFSEKAAIIIKKRAEFSEMFNQLFRKSYSYIAERDNTPLIEYNCSAGNNDSGGILKKLQERRIRDIMTGTSGIGPQRDDFILKNDEGTAFVNYASQGQRRTAAIALKIAECEIIEEKMKKKSIILVDDIFSELDDQRRKNMVSILSRGNQVIFTMVNIGSVDMNSFPDARHYRITGDGKIHPA